MANLAMKDQSERTVQVNRMDLILKLKANRTAHFDAYNVAIEGYCEMAKEKLADAHVKAKLKLEENVRRGMESLDKFDPSQPGTQSDYITLVDAISVTLKVPRNFTKEYDAAIDMAEWDVRDELELTHAEFQCFVRDVWDWTNEFMAVSATYSKAFK